MSRRIEPIRRGVLARPIAQVAPVVRREDHEDDDEPQDRPSPPPRTRPAPPDDGHAHVDVLA